MVIKSYSVTLEEDLVVEAKKEIKSSGGKLSPILNNLLQEWLDHQKINKEQEEQIGSS